MYTSYEQFKVVRTILNGYARENAQHFVQYAEMLKEHVANSTLDINNPSAIQTMTNLSNQMSNHQKDYLTAKGVLGKLENIARGSYEAAIPLESQVDTTALQAKGDDMFLDVLSSMECTGIMGEIAYGLFVQQKYPIDIRPAYDMQAINDNEAQIKNLLDNGKITKEQAVYWSTMSTALVNSSDFVEWANQFQKPNTL